jgi:hypothetical protein
MSNSNYSLANAVIFRIQRKCSHDNIFFYNLRNKYPKNLYVSLVICDHACLRFLYYVAPLLLSSHVCARPPCCYYRLCNIKVLGWDAWNYTTLIQSFAKFCQLFQEFGGGHTHTRQHSGPIGLYFYLRKKSRQRICVYKNIDIRKRPPLEPTRQYIDCRSVHILPSPALNRLLEVPVTFKINYNEFNFDKC